MNAKSELRFTTVFDFPGLLHFLIARVSQGAMRAMLRIAMMEYFQISSVSMQRIVSPL